MSLPKAKALISLLVNIRSPEVVFVYFVDMCLITFVKEVDLVFFFRFLFLYYVLV